VTGATWESSGDANCHRETNLASTQAAPEAAVGFYPVQFERLGKVRNELDVVGPIGGPAGGRAAAPSR
jgi:hypothetical protein